MKKRKHCKEIEAILNGTNKELAEKLRRLLGEADKPQEEANRSKAND